MTFLLELSWKTYENSIFECQIYQTLNAAIMKAKRAIFLFFVLLMASVILSGCTSSQPSIIILEHNGAIASNSGTYIVQGTAQNTGTRPVAKVYIVVTTYDASGAEIGSSYDTLLNLNPGDEAQFKVEARHFYQGTRVARYDILPNYNSVPSR